MATRGTIKIIVKEKEFVTYNHFDSYPEGLGNDIVAELKSLLTDYSKEQIVSMAYNMRMVSESETASEQDIEKFKQFANTTVSTRQLSEWYVLLRNMQGHIRPMLLEGIIIGGATSEEYNYVIDFNKWEFSYEGFSAKIDLTTLPEKAYKYESRNKFRI